MITDVIKNGKCVYPKKKINNNRNITDDEIKYWKQLRKKGLSYEKIAEKAGRNPTQIKYHLSSYRETNINAAKNYIMAHYDKYKEVYRIAVAKNQKKRYADDLDYRVYSACRTRCKSITKHYGTLENYYRYRKLLFEAEKDPNISKTEYKKIKLNLLSKFKSK